MKKINLKNLEKSINTAKSSGYFENLDKIYNTVPQGKCHGCTKCCAESVNTHYVEFLHIFRYFQENRRLYELLIPKILRHYFLEMVEKAACPFLNEEGLCHIYRYRPLVCRLFGHWTEEEYEQNYRLVLASNLQNVKFFKNKYGIDLPEEVVQHKIHYCKDFEVNKRIKEKQRQSMLDSIFTMESAFFMRGLITEDFIGTGLPAWFVYTYFDVEEAGKLRIQIMREYVEHGESETLENVLSKIKMVL